MTGELYQYITMRSSTIGFMLYAILTKLWKILKRFRSFSLLQDADARTGFIWEIHTYLYTCDLFDELLPPPTVQVKELSGFRDHMLPNLHIYKHFHRTVKWNQRCIYTNNNPIHLQPTYMTTLPEEQKNRYKWMLCRTQYIAFCISEGEIPSRNVTQA